MTKWKEEKRLSAQDKNKQFYLPSSIFLGKFWHLLLDPRVHMEQDVNQKVDGTVWHDVYGQNGDTWL